MIHFDDLVAARILDRMLPELRTRLLAAVDALAREPSQRGLIASLLAGETITPDQAQHVRRSVEHTKRGRGVALYARLLASQGLPGPALRECVDRLSPEADLNALGDAVVARGLIPAEREQPLRFHLRVISDRDQAENVQRFLASRQGAAPAPPEVGTSISTVIRVGPIPPPEAEPAPVADPTVMPEGLMSSGLHEGFRPPGFPVPGWIDTSDPCTGTWIREYRVFGRIGAGAMGIVYLADHKQDPTRPVALKVLNAQATPEARGRFKREILANSMFSHPGVIDVYDAGKTSLGEDYLAMEFFDGEDLAQVLETVRHLEPARAIDLCKQVFEALGAAHAAGIVHRDVKPANILVSRDGTAARLMDFGVAIIRDLGEFESAVFSSVEGGSTGTPEFMSPEQAAGDKVLGASDLYSMGLVLYQCLSGRLPFESETSGGFMACHMMEEPLPLAKAGPGLKALPKELHQLLASLLRKTPAERPRSAAEVVAVLGQVLAQVQRDKKPSASGRLWASFWRDRGG